LQTHISLSSTVSFELREALLVYRSSEHRSSSTSVSAFVTKHSVRLSQSGIPSLDAGSPIHRADIFELIQQLRGALPVEFLPANVLVRTQESIVWWTAPAIHSMFYAKEKGIEVAQLSGRRFPQPSLVFRAQAGSLDIRALASNERPGRKTPLYRAPYWNVNDSGEVCLGTTQVPKEVTIDSLARWESAFFESEFTHPNATRKLTEHPGGFVALWKSLIGRRYFPGEHLANAKENLGDFIRRRSSDG
jgi:PRTRC genetic system protein B